MRIPAIGPRVRRLARLATLPGVALLIAACTDQVNTNPTGDSAAPSLLTGEVVTTQGSQAASLYVPIFIVATIIFFLIEGLLLYMAWRFRKRSTGDDLPEQTHGNNRLELIWTIIPAIIVTTMFVGSMIVLADVEASPEGEAMVVDVEAFRFGWKFDYPDYGISIAGGGREGAPEMVLPTEDTVRFRITAVDVIHSFYVPSFFTKLDAIPGRVNILEVNIEEPGVYGGQCAEFCGLAHSDMYFSVRAVEPAEFAAWVDEQQAGPPEQGPPDEGAPDEGPPDQGAVLEIGSSADRPIAYTTSSLEAKAGETVTLRYTNEANVPHNVTIYDSPDASGSVIAETETITGPGASSEVTFAAPDTPGPYFFRCTLHPLQMTGTLTVTP